MTLPTQAVLRVMLAEPGRWDWYGYDLAKATGLRSGTLYPILGRLKTAGLLTCRPEQGHVLGRPPRKYYSFAPGGAVDARGYLAEADRRTALAHAGRRR